MNKQLFKITATLFFLIFFVNTVYADQFQFKDKTYGSYVAYSHVSISNKYNGQTDKFGRITIDLPNGIYKCEIIFNRKEIILNLTIDGSNKLKLMYID